MKPLRPYCLLFVLLPISSTVHALTHRFGSVCDQSVAPLAPSDCVAFGAKKLPAQFLTIKNFVQRWSGPLHMGWDATITFASRCNGSC